MGRGFGAATAKKKKRKGKRKTKRKSKRKTSKKRGRKRAAGKARSRKGKGKVPDAILERRAKRLFGIMKKRGLKIPTKC